MKLETSEAIDLLAFGYEKGAASPNSAWLLCFVFAMAYFATSVAVAVWYVQTLLAKAKLLLHEDQLEIATTQEAAPAGDRPRARPVRRREPGPGGD
jgi:hypothetical protein